MTNKQKRKLHRHARIEVAKNVQNYWIERAFGMSTDNRRMRDILFGAAREQLGAEMDRGRHVVAQG